jgi:hypothetical protein
MRRIRRGEAAMRIGGGFELGAIGCLAVKARTRSSLIVQVKDAASFKPQVTISRGGGGGGTGTTIFAATTRHFLPDQLNSTKVVTDTGGSPAPPTKQLAVGGHERQHGVGVVKVLLLFE